MRGSTLEMCSDGKHTPRRVADENLSVVAEQAILLKKDCLPFRHAWIIAIAIPRLTPYSAKRYEVH
jgi:hypothetical protein